MSRSITHVALESPRPISSRRPSVRLVRLSSSIWWLKWQCPLSHERAEVLPHAVCRPINHQNQRARNNRIRLCTKCRNVRYKYPTLSPLLMFFIITDGFPTKMADPFSVATGVIAVVAFAGKLTKGIDDLNSLRKAYKGLPDEVDDLIDDLELLQSIIWDLENGRFGVGDVNCVAVDRGLRRAKQVTSKLDSLVSELRDNVSGSQAGRRRLNMDKIKAAMRSSVEQYSDRVQAVLNILQTAQGAQIL